MTKTIEKQKNEKLLKIAERKVKKAEVRTRKIDKKLKRAKKKDEGKDVTKPLKGMLTDAFKRLKRNEKQLKKVKQKVA